MVGQPQSKQAAEVELRRKVGVAEARLRKWLLLIAATLRNNNGSIMDAIGAWKVRGTLVAPVSLSI